MSRIRQCPHCDGTSGVYQIDWQRWILCWTWDGEEDGGDVGVSKSGKTLYCRDCHRRVMDADAFFEKEGA